MKRGFQIPRVSFFLSLDSSAFHFLDVFKKFILYVCFSVSYKARFSKAPLQSSCWFLPGVRHYHTILHHTLSFVIWCQECVVWWTRPATTCLSLLWEKAVKSSWLRMSRLKFQIRFVSVSSVLLRSFGVFWHSSVAEENDVIVESSLSIDHPTSQPEYDLTCDSVVWRAVKSCVR